MFYTVQVGISCHLLLFPTHNNVHPFMNSVFCFLKSYPQESTLNNIPTAAKSSDLPFFPGPHYKESRRVKYSEQTFGLSIVLTALLALVIGFALGLLASKGCCQEQKLDGAMANEIYDKTLNFTK